MRVVIVEDELLIAEQLQDILEENNCEVIGVAQNIANATNLIKLKPDFVFLDIQLKNDENGIELGKVLSEIQVPFLYLTANSEVNTLKDAISTNPISYISKPFKTNDVIASLELVKIKRNLKPKLTLKLANKDISIFLEDILYCEAKGAYTEIFTKNNTFTKRINLKDFQELLNEDFRRIHRSFVVNKKQITYRTSNSVFFNTTEIPISKLYKDNI